MEESAAKKIIFGRTWMAKMYAQLCLSSASFPNKNSVPLWLISMRLTNTLEDDCKTTRNRSGGHNFVYTQRVTIAAITSIFHFNNSGCLLPMLNAITKIATALIVTTRPDHEPKSWFEKINPATSKICQRKDNPTSSGCRVIASSPRTTWDPFRKIVYNKINPKKIQKTGCPNAVVCKTPIANMTCAMTPINTSFQLMARRLLLRM